MTEEKLVRRLLIANRGEIAFRIWKTAKRLGYFVITIYTPTDATSPHVLHADLALPVSSYTSMDEIIELIKLHHVQGVIPGYGFLSENADFATAVEAAGASFVGPSPEHISMFGIKDRARDLAVATGVPVCPGSGIIDSEDDAVTAADEIGYPVMLKATAGGGGMGLQICEDEHQVRASFQSVVSRGKTLFSNPGVFLERYYPVSRHIEVQIFGNGAGDCAILGERECSIQRRHQKVIEESPSPFVETRPQLREQLFRTSELLGSSIKYRSAGTIEYLVDDDTGDFFFLEMNTRLQVEHGITELRFGIDLVELMLQQAEAMIDLSRLQSLTPKGTAIEARVYAENPLKNHMPSPGILQYVRFDNSSGVRVDTWVETGTTVSLDYDPMLAKVMGYGESRKDATSTIVNALEETRLQGIVTNLDYLIKILGSKAFAEGKTTTNFLEKFDYAPRAIEIISPGSYTTIQDCPGRVGVGFGIPEGGPMDQLGAQLANCIVGNDRGSELLEITFIGPKIKFHHRAIFAVAGATLEMDLDGITLPMWSRIEAKAGSILTIGRLLDGCRAYLAIKGGFPGIPEYLGFKSTSPVIGVGGLQGRQLVAGDLLDVKEAGVFSPFTLAKDLVPTWDQSIVYCLSGPHDSPDIIAPEGLQSFYEKEWTVSHQASRLGVRLHGPEPKWARKTGGQGGSHPSNYLDYPYSVGAINWTGDTSVIFPADAPSLGGFISSHVIPRAELFKVGQMRPGDKFRFQQISFKTAITLRKLQDEYLQGIARLAHGHVTPVIPLELRLPKQSENVFASAAVLGVHGDITLRQAGDSYLLIEYPQSLDLDVRCKVQSIVEALQRANIKGLRLVTPMACSLLIEYDGLQIIQTNLVEIVLDVLRAECSASLQSKKLSSRHIRLPMVFDDKVNNASIERYMETQRNTASYLPDPVDFIARSNGLSSKAEVLQKVLSTRILVVGVGFFSGTPIAIPLDPRCQLIVPKFNPPRLMSPAGGLGIGGIFFSCDPIDAPGGYVNFGRTLPGWDKFCVNKSFNGRPWLFNNFDQLSFYPVDEDEFEQIEARFKAGKFEFDITPTVLNMEEYSKFCQDVAAEAAEFRAKQTIATEVELEKENILLSQWQEQQKIEKEITPIDLDANGSFKLAAEIHASVYKLPIQKGTKVKAGDVLVILEAMKMEISIAAAQEHDGMEIIAVAVGSGDIVKPGDTLLVFANA